MHSSHILQDNDGKEAITQKPYLWVKRRYAMPAFELSQPNNIAACPWECSDALKGVILPPASLYTSQSALKKLREAPVTAGGFDIDAQFEIKTK